jgi:hypothetical protein
MDLNRMANSRCLQRRKNARCMIIFGGRMQRTILVALAAALFSAVAPARVAPVPTGFHTQRIATHGTTFNVRVGGKSPAFWTR